MMLQAGMMLLGRYEILEKIGSGGMSDVYKVKCHKLNRLVAIKVLKTEYTTDAGFINKFRMEAQAAAGLSHPNIVNVYDVEDEGNLHFIVMELVEGITLKSYIAKKGYLDVKESIGISIQVAQGIEAAHEQKIIHRDIKPQNMLISRDGKVKVADFGIARATSSQTMNTTVVGSVHYISPEQARGGYSDERSDIYSFGITMFEMVTGRVPFDGDNTVTVALAHLENPIARPSMINPEVSLALEKIILKCTEKSPERRYASISEVISDLRRALLNPADSAVAKPEMEDLLGHTRPITKKELDIITGRNEIKPEIKVSHVQTPKQPEPVRQYKSVREPVREEPIQEESSQLEKLMTAVGVVAAIIVVAVVIVVFSKIGGFFRTPENKETENTIVAESEELSQKEVRMPNLVGDTQEEAEAKLEELDLSMKVVLEKDDLVEEGRVIAQDDEPGAIISRYSKVIVTISSGSDRIDLASLRLTEITLDTAIRLIEGKGLKTAVVEENHDEAQAGTIIRHDPVEYAHPGDTVTLYISKGPAVKMMQVPNLVGQASDVAMNLLTESGLQPGEIKKEHHDSVPAGSVIRQGLNAGDEVEEGSALDYVLSLGPKEPDTQFVASLEASYPLMVSYGPGAPLGEIEILIRLKQTVDGQIEYTELAEPEIYTTDTMLDIRFSKIRGAQGVLTGEVEVVDLTNDLVLTSYNVNFVEMEV